MNTTIFNLMKTSDKIEDISSSISVNNVNGSGRTKDTLAYCKLYKFGKLVFGGLRIVAGTELKKSEYIAKGFPIPDSNRANYVTAVLKCAGVSFCAWVEYGTGYLKTGSGNSTLAASSGCIMSVLYICE